MIKVTGVDPCEFQISWDPNDPSESILNTWTEQDFIDVISTNLKNIIENEHPNIHTQTDNHK